MEIQAYFDKMKEIHNNLLSGFDDPDEEKIEDMIQIFPDCQNSIDCHILKSILHMIVKMSNHHHRTPSFFIKIEQILQFFKEKIQTNYSNYEIFEIFKSNKRILLILIENQILTIDNFIASVILTEEKYKKANYAQYFYPEIKPFLGENEIKEISKGIEFENFEENRKIGENHHYISKLIREDLVEDFIIYVNRTNASLLNVIRPSIFETNKFLIENNPTLIEYAAFYGSIQIFKYLRFNKVSLDAIIFELTPSLWFYTIHSMNPELIHTLEEYNIQPIYDSYQDCFVEAIKCHHCDIANYISLNLLSNDRDSFYEITIKSLKYYNFSFILIDHIKSSWFYLCRYDYYYPFVKIILDGIDINYKLVLNAFKNL
ncbi:hypothetical protein M9Y10_029544 [Tritrichomonas musculus]|uniref:DUF3447 domain-containing protein n=1 Tax=Tritrichomonas musculus TaxID=1915356 RepID=A0ABR2KMV2_9EUKA